jgi:putative membrane protein
MFRNGPQHKGRSASNRPSAPTAVRPSTYPTTHLPGAALENIRLPARPQQPRTAPSAETRRSAGPSLLWPGLVAVLVALGIGLGISAARGWLAALAHPLKQALWLLPLLVALHLGQLLLSAIAWRGLLPGQRGAAAAFYRLRIIREGIDSLLPVAQVGGEIVGARLLARRGVALSRAAASVVVDVTVELLTQLLFLLAGLLTLALLRAAGAATGLKLLLAAAAIAALFLLAQRLGLLRMIETLTSGVARRWPSLAGLSLDGLHDCAVRIYRQPGPMLRGAALHFTAWIAGCLESWAVLHAMGVKVSPAQALVIESLGMAGRSGGFAIPAALGAQEGGFVLAAAAVGVALAPALALSLVKRLREILVGLIGMALWRQETARRHPLSAGEPA